MVQVVYFALSGLCNLIESYSQGVALGCDIQPFQGY